MASAGKRGRSKPYDTSLFLDVKPLGSLLVFLPKKWLKLTKMTRVVLSAIIGLVLFIGGIILLALRIPFWGLFLGLPATQTGIILSIFSFDRLSQKEAEKEIEEAQASPCSSCDNSPFIKGKESRQICSKCGRKITREG